MAIGPYLVSFCHLGMDQYLLIPFLGDEHPFTSYFDVHQGYKVLTHCHFFNGNSRNPNWRYLYTIYVWPIFQGYVRGYTPNSYGLKNGTNVPPFWDPGIPIDFLQEKTCCKTKPDVRVRPALFLRGQICHPL